MADPAKRVGLFVTCLVDLMRPSVRFRGRQAPGDAGCTVAVPRQSCCGQPAFNSGDRRSARAFAEQVIEAFAPSDYVVAPSGSCAGMLKAHYPELFHGDPNWLPRADALAAKTYELVILPGRCAGDPRASMRSLEGTATYRFLRRAAQGLGVRIPSRAGCSARCVASR